MREDDMCVTERERVAVMQGYRHADALLIHERAVPAPHVDEDILTGVHALNHGVVARDEVVFEHNGALAAAAELPQTGSDQRYAAVSFGPADAQVRRLG